LLSRWRRAAGAGYDELVEAALQIGPSAEGLIFLPYLSGERSPHLDPQARSVIVGFTARGIIPHPPS